MGYEKKSILIFGKSGSGKSYLAARLLAERHRVFIYDKLHEYTDGVVFYADELDKLAAFWAHVYCGNFRIIFRTKTIDKQKRFIEIDMLSHLVWECGNMTFVIEEFAGYCSANYTPDMLGQIVLMGRHRNIELIGIQQRPFNLNPDIRSQTKEIYLFNTTEPGDLDYFKGLTRESIADRMDQLKQYEYLYWHDQAETLTVSRQ